MSSTGSSGADVADSDTPPPELEWAPDAAPTSLDVVPVDPETTGPVPVESLAGFEPGRRAGYLAGYRAGVDDALDALRLAMMEQGTDAGTAYRTAERVARRIRRAP